MNNIATIFKEFIKPPKPNTVSRNKCLSEKLNRCLRNYYLIEKYNVDIVRIQQRNLSKFEISLSLVLIRQERR